MKQFLSFLICILLSACGAFSSLTSGTTIRANDQFVLGDNEHGPFKAVLRNDAAQSLTIYTERKGITPPEVVLLKPTQKIELWVGANETVIIQNKGNRTAQVYLKITGDTDLGMTYKPVSN